MCLSGLLGHGAVHVAGTGSDNVRSAVRCCTIAYRRYITYCTVRPVRYSINKISQTFDTEVVATQKTPPPDHYTLGRRGRHVDLIDGVRPWRIQDNGKDHSSLGEARVRLIDTRWASHLGIREAYQPCKPPHKVCIVLCISVRVQKVPSYSKDGPEHWKSDMRLNPSNLDQSDLQYYIPVL